MSSYVVRAALPADMAGIAEILNQQGAGPVTAEELLRADRLQPPDRPALRLVAATEQGAIAATARVWNNGTGFWCWVRVANPHTRQGLGTDLYRTVERSGCQMGAERLQAICPDQDPGALAFAQRVGFTLGAHEMGFRLHLSAWDDARVDEAARKASQAGVSVHPWAELAGTAGSADQLYQVHCRIHSATDLGGGRPAPFPAYPEWRDRLDTADVRLVSMTSTTDARNGAMRSIFRQLGYESMPGWCILHKDLA